MKKVLVITILTILICFILFIGDCKGEIMGKCRGECIDLIDIDQCVQDELGHWEEADKNKELNEIKNLNKDEINVSLGLLKKRGLIQLGKKIKKLNK